MLGFLTKHVRRTKLSHRAVDAVLFLGTKAVHLEETISQARPLVEAEFRDIDAEDRSDGGARPLDERTLLGYKDVNLLTTCD